MEDKELTERMKQLTESLETLQKALQKFACSAKNATEAIHAFSESHKKWVDIEPIVDQSQWSWMCPKCHHEAEDTPDHRVKCTNPDCDYDYPL